MIKKKGDIFLIDIQCRREVIFMCVYPELKKGGISPSFEFVNFFLFDQINLKLRQRGWMRWSVRVSARVSNSKKKPGT